MTLQIISTKLNIPPTRPTLVSRPRLLERLQEGSVKKLTLISAPAGFGKTTLVSAWAEHAPTPVAWLSLDFGDNDLARFLTYIIAAIQRVAVDVGRQALSALKEPQSPANEIILTSLINDLEDYSNPIAIILDDYHLIETQDVHDAVLFLLDHLPSNTHLVIVTRADPPLPVSRYRGRGQVNELRAADLSFDRSESARFLEDIAQLPLSADDITAMQTRTEGWIAGLQMAAISMRGRTDLPSFIVAFTGSQEYIADYLTDEVVQQQPDETRDFLLKTSILNRMTGPLCDAVIDSTGSQSILEKIHDDNLFLLALDDEQRWYRYHHLFAELLNQRLQQRSPGLIPQLHQRASQWFEAQGLLPESINHALDAHDFENAPRMIDDVFDQLWEIGEVATLRGWLKRLPEDVFHAWPQLTIRQAMFFVLAGQNDVATRALDEAAQRLSKKQAVDTMKWQGITACLRAHLAWMSVDISGIVHHSEDALGLLPKHEYEWRSFASMTLGIALDLKGNPIDAGVVYERALETARKSGNLRFILAPSFRLASNLKNRGHLAQSLDLCEQCIQLIEDRGHSHPSYLGSFYSLSADILCEWNRLDEALKLAQQGLALGKQAFKIDTLSLNYYLLIRVLISNHDYLQAGQMLQELEKVFREHDAPQSLESRIAELKLLLLLYQGDLEGVDRYINIRAPYSSDESDREYLMKLGEFIQWARFLLMRGRQRSHDSSLRESQALLARLEQVTRKTHAVEILIRVLALKAIALQAVGDRTQAMDALGDALRLGEQGGYLRTFIDEGATMQGLLHQAEIPGISPDYLSKLQAGFMGAESPPVIVAPTLQEPLSERELQVLYYLKTHLTTNEIAEALYLSVHTVRSHIKSIYSKLQVHSRTQAVEEAQRLGLEYNVKKGT